MKRRIQEQLAGQDWAALVNKSEARSAERFVSRGEKKPGADQTLYTWTMLRAQRRAEIAAQHGPVKILWKDGKPVARGGDCQNTDA